jgi:hypothetical protein
MDTVQLKAHIPRGMWHQFKVLLAVRDQSYAQWLRAHIDATLREEARRQQLMRPSAAVPALPHESCSTRPAETP